MTTTTTVTDFAAIDALGQRAADLAMRAAAQFIRTHKLTVDVDALVIALRIRAKEAAGIALDDAREALAANMGAFAEQTFAASLTLAGIQAVKDVTA